MMKELMRGARTAVKCVGIRPGESVLVLTDTDMPRVLSRALEIAAKEKKARAVLEIMKPLKVNGEEPPKAVAKLIGAHEIAFLLTSKSLSHTSARRRASKKGVRIASMPGITRFSFTEGGLTANYEKVKELTGKMYRKIRSAKRIHVTAPNGTDVVMSVARRKWIKDDGNLKRKGSFNNLPAGEVCTAPREGSAEGIVVFDNVKKRAKLIVEKGRAVKIIGYPKLKRVVNKIGEEARNIAEIGIGTNPKAKIIGNVLEDEKVFGTVHMAIGNSKSLGGKVDVPLHIDGIIKKPTLVVDGKTLIKNRKWTFI